MIFFGKGTCVDPFYMHGKAIEIVTSEKHLGNIMGKNILEKQVEQAVRELYSNVNLLMSQLSYVYIDTMYNLFKSFCMSVYGSALWDYSNKTCERF